jgi:uncharacterized protein (TIGR02808 family)
MSTLENIFWHVLGYSAMPLIFITGFVAVAAGSLLLLSLVIDKE